MDPMFVLGIAFDMVDPFLGDPCFDPGVSGCDPDCGSLNIGPGLSRLSPGMTWVHQLDGHIHHDVTFDDRH